MARETKHPQFEEAAQRRRALLDGLKELPIREVSGVVGARGASGSQLLGETLWTLAFDFEDWRVPGAEMQGRPLHLSKEVPKEQLRSYQAEISPYCVLRVRAHVADDNGGRARGLLVEVLGLDTADFELLRLAQRLQEPVSFIDQRFGAFHLDRRTGDYNGTAGWNAEPVRLTLRVEMSGEPSACLNIARELWSSSEDWNRRIVECAVAGLLDLKNESWLEPGEENVTADELRRRLQLEAISVDGHGEFEFWFADGGLFGGHSILVDGSMLAGPRRAELLG